MLEYLRHAVVGKRSLIVTLFVLMPVAVSRADDGLKVGDTIEFGFMGGTKQAQIIKFTGTGWPIVKFEHGGREMERFFPTSRVKLVTPDTGNAGTAGLDMDAAAAESPMREWVDATGKFKIQAKMLSRTEDTVELEKSDGRIINLPVNKLSESDQSYLAELQNEQASDNPFAGGVMKSDRTSAAPPKPPTGKGTAAKTTVDSIKPDGSTNGQTLADNGWRYQSTSPVSGDETESTSIINLPNSTSKHAFHNRVAAVASFDRQMLAISRGNPFADETEILAVDVANRRSSPIAKVAIKETTAFAVSPDGKYVVTHKKSFGSKSGSIDFWKLSDGVATHAASWETAGFHDRNGFAPSEGMFVGSTKLLTLGRRIVLWDLGAASAEYSIPRANGAAATISHSGRELAMTDAGDVVLVGIAQGNALGRFRPPGRTTSLAFSPGGQFLAGLNAADSSIWVWDLEGNELVQQLGVPGRATSMRWTDDRYLLVGPNLLDIELRVPVWQYTVSGGQLIAGRNGGLSLVGKTKITPVRLPHKNLDAQTASLDPEQLLILKPGAKVAFDFQLPFPPAEQKTIRDQLAASLQSNQITINQSAPLRLVAKVTKGKPTTTTLSRFGRFGQGEAVNYTPSTALIQLIRGGKTIWSQQRVFSPGGVVSIGQNETAQQAVTKLCQPKASFFTKIELPKYLAAMPSGEPLGKSIVNEAGVQ